MVIKADKLLNKSSGRLAMQKAQQEKMIGGGPSNIVLSKKSIKGIEGIKINVIKIENILKGSLALDKKQLDDKKKATSKKRKEDIETKLETKPNAESGGKVKLPAAPRMGILDWIKNFIGNILLGYFAVRLIKHLPKIMPILKFLGGAADFIINTGGFLLNGLATFLDIGYKAYDATRGFLKSFGGENFVKVFDAFNGAVGSVIEAAIIASIALASQGKDGVLDIGMDLLKDRLLGQGAQAATQAATSSSASAAAGGGASTAGGTAAQAGGLGVGAVAAVVAGAGLLSSALGEGAFQVRKFAVKPIQKLENDQKNDKNPFTRFGRGVALNMIRPLFGLFQAVGVLLDIVGAPFRYAIELLRYPFLSEEDKVKQAGNLAKFDARIREDFRKALNMLTLGLAFKEKGSFGNIYGNQGAQKEMMGKMAGGGITRGGKSAGRAKRTFGGMKKKQTYKRTIAQKPTQVQIKPGADVGGEDKIFGIFPNPLKAAKKVIDIVNPFNVIKTAGEDLGKTDYFGPILAITSKMILGQKPDQIDYKNVGLGLNLLIAKGVQDGQLKGGIIPAFAEGGLVDPDVLSAVETGGDISSWVSNVFRGEIETGAQKTMRLIKENMDKKKAETDPPSDPISDPNVLGSSGGGTADTSLNPYRRAFLDTLAYAEGTGGYPNTGYNTMFTGKQFAGYKDHPRKIQVSGKYRSDAAGRYQFLSTTWDGLGLTDFSPANQDKGALKLLAPHVLTAIDKGDFATAFHGARKTWASLPGAGYGQPEKSMKILVGYANNRVGQYQKGEIGSPTGPGMSVSMAPSGSLPGWSIDQNKSKQVLLNILVEALHII
jgi:muramidase (phage lysozyme)